MRMIDVYNKMAKNQIQLGTKLIIDEKVFEYGQYCSSDGYCFIDEDNENVYSYYDIDSEFLNKEVELITQQKKYLIKVNVRGLDENFTYLNYVRFGKCVVLNSRVDSEDFMAHFAKSEIQLIKPVREFLEDVPGKYELIEVTDNEK